MTQQLIDQIEAIRNRATQAQHHAADPSTSVWVSANAGTGKTRVLTNRILRLLLDGAQVTDILAVTYTRTAAQEMRNRVFETLAEWARISGTQLTEAIRKTGITKPTEKQRQRARQLFAQLLDQPVGLRIETVHAFSQSVLRRFPVEAGVQPYFELASDVQRETLKHQTATSLLASSDQLVQEAVKVLAARFGVDRLMVLVSDFSAYLDVIETFRNDPVAVKRQLIAQLCGSTLESDDFAVIRQQKLKSILPDENTIRKLYLIARAIIDHGSKSEIETKLPVLSDILDNHEDLTEEQLHAYTNLLLTQEGTIKDDSNLLTNSVDAIVPFGRGLMTHEGKRLQIIYQHLHGIETAELSFYLLVLADAMSRGYHEAKRQAGLMDYDDLILTTHRLLSAAGGAAWVRYKLDRGINHLLIDEAQDTSPEQWQILSTLAQEFFVSEEDVEKGKPPRSLFSVGDYKQSIYSFQGARPDLFVDQETAFRTLARDHHKPFTRVDLDTSFRSVSPILTLVDKVTQAADDGNPRLPGLGEAQNHGVERQGQGGFVELMPLVEKEEQEEDPKVVLCRRIVRTIQDWIGVRMLPSRGRAMMPGDILILLRDRQPGGLYKMLDRQLRLAGLPVAGADRVKLNEEIAVQDLLALGRAVLLPEDDLSLAAVLKSPLFGLNENHLFRLASQRGKSSLHARFAAMAAEDEDIGKAHDQFTAWLDLAEKRMPHGFYSTVLKSEIRQTFAHRLGNHVAEVLAEFLELARQYELIHPPSLIGFIEDMETSQAEISRESEARSRNEIRIMTIHGAKGLEAPVVILPDTLYQEPKPARVTPLETDSGKVLPVVQIKGRCKHPQLVKAAENTRTDSRNENDRLFYVAMTRAEDGLLVAGFDGGRRKRAGSWFDAIETALSDIDTHDKAAPDQSERSHQPSEHFDKQDDGFCRLSSEQVLAVDVEALPSDNLPDAGIPDWLNKPAPPEEQPPRPLSPSRFSVSEPARSPVGEDRKKAMERGVLAHRLVEILPRLQGEAQEKAAARILDAGVSHLTQNEAEQIRDEIMALINTPALADLFGPDARAEVPVSGLVGKTVVSGVIDRLIVMPDKITLIDFKTGAPPEGALSADYISQMALYRHLVQSIWPGRAVVAGLLYTEDASVHWVDDHQMDKVIADLTEQS